LSIDLKPSVSPGTYPGILVSAPIDQVVPAFAPRSRVVRDFIGRQARVRTNHLRHIVERPRGVLVRRDQLARCMQLVKGRALLDGELIKREMLARLRNGALELVGPALGRLPRKGIDEIEGIAIEH